MNLEEQFTGRRVFITGHTGFKGSWLSLWLLRLGADITGYALPPKTEDDLFVKCDLQSKLHSIVGDINDYEKLHRAMLAAQPDFVFHLAAQPLVRHSYEDPLETFATNVVGSANLLEAVRHVPSVKSLIYVTTDKCYKDRKWVWGYRESDELGGRDPYSASKAAAELIFSSYQDSFFHYMTDFSAASVRAGNVIGGGDWAVDRIVPDCINALRNRAPIVLRSPFATRPWQHVLEPLGGYLMLASQLAGREGAAYAGAWNFGPSTDSKKSVQQLADKIIQNWGSGTLVHTEADEAKIETMTLQLNSEKAHTDLCWRPIWDFQATVQETVGWYKAMEEGVDCFEFTNDQITRYYSEFKRKLEMSND